MTRRKCHVCERAWNETAEKRPRQANCEMLTPTAQMQDSISMATAVVW